MVVAVAARGDKRHCGHLCSVRRTWAGRRRPWWWGGKAIIGGTRCPRGVLVARLWKGNPLGGLLPFRLLMAAGARAWMGGGCEDAVARSSIGASERAYTRSEGASAAHVWIREVGIN